MFKKKRIPTKFLPPDFAPLIQQMEKHIMQKIKLHYCKYLPIYVLYTCLKVVSDPIP